MKFLNLLQIIQDFFNVTTSLFSEKLFSHKNNLWWREEDLDRTVKFAEKRSQCDRIYLKIINDIWKKELSLSYLGN